MGLKRQGRAGATVACDDVTTNLKRTTTELNRDIFLSRYSARWPTRESITANTGLLERKVGRRLEREPWSVSVHARRLGIGYIAIVAPQKGNTNQGQETNASADHCRNARRQNGRRTQNPNCDVVVYQDQ